VKEGSARASGPYVPDNFEKIDRFFPGNAPKFDLGPGIPQAGDIPDVPIAHLDGLGTTKPAFLVINIPDIQFIKSEAEPVGHPRGGNGAEENNRRRAAATLESVVFRKFRHAADHDPDFAGNRHPDHRLAEEIGGHLIIRYNNAGSLQKGNPGFQDLAMYQTVIDPHKGYIQ
jgi:hypothetical protein